MFQIMLQIFVYSSSVMAMTPPDGWISLGDGHAIREENSPEKGELLELQVEESVVSLGFGLMDSGFNVLNSTQEDNGDITMILDDGRQGVARYTAERWIVLFYGKSSKTRPDKVFSKVTFDNDTTPWGEAQKDTSNSWNPSITDEWGVDEKLVGSWVCTSMIKGRPIKLSIAFDSDGAVRWEETRAGKTTTMKGEWLASPNKLAIQLEDRTMFVDFDLFQGGLKIRYDNSNFSLYRR